MKILFVLFVIVAAVARAQEITDTTETTSDTTEATSETTEQPETSTEQPGRGRPNPGDPCNPDECLTDGYCLTYLRCDKENKTWVEETCGQDLLWNPFNPNGTRHIHGGNCDRHENLLAETKESYRKNRDCLGCFWEELGKCNAEYDYQPANGTYRNVLRYVLSSIAFKIYESRCLHLRRFYNFKIVLRLSCSTGLVFVGEKATCQRCQDATDKNGNPCCAGA